MNFFLFCLIILLCKLDSAVDMQQSTFPEEGIIPRQFNQLLQDKKIEEFTLVNKTNMPVNVGMYSFYHIESRFRNAQKNAPTLFIFSNDNQVVKAKGEAEVGQVPSSRVSVCIGQEGSGEPDIILRRMVPLLPNEQQVIRAIERAYIGRVICETLGKQIDFSRIDDRVLLIEDLQMPLEVTANSFSAVHSIEPYHFTWDSGFFERLINYAGLLPFRDYASLATFAEHKIKQDAFYKKMLKVHQSGIDILNARVAGNFQIPQVIHTLLTRKDTENNFLNINQKRWLMQSMQNLPVSGGWKHKLWTFEEVSLEDLGLSGYDVEIVPIVDSCLFCQEFMQELMTKGLIHHASILFQYAVLSNCGGIFRPVDTAIVQDISLLNQGFSFYAGLEVASGRMIAGDFVAAAPGHPVIRETLSLVQRYIHQYLEKNMLQNNDKRFDNVLLSTSFARWGNQGKDMIFAPTVFAPRLACPEIHSWIDSFGVQAETHAIAYGNNGFFK